MSVPDPDDASALELGDSPRDALLPLPISGSQREYEQETDDLLERRVQKLDSKAHNKKLRGWLSYAFASEVFAVVSLTLFLPICLEQYARDNGFLLPDRTVPCSTQVDHVPQQTTEPLIRGGPIPTPDEVRCVIKLGWLWVDTASFSLYVYSFSVALQAITVISMGTIADQPQHRKLLLLAFAALGSTSAILFIALPSSSPVWLLCALLTALANVSFGASTVVANSYLPTLARSSGQVRKLAAAVERIRSNFSEEDDQFSVQEDGPTSALKLALESYTKAVSRAAASISAKGIAIGYAAGIVLLAVAIIPVTLLGGTTFSLRLAISLSGIWWAFFTIPAAIWLPGGKVRTGMLWGRSGFSAPRGWMDPVRRATGETINVGEDNPRVWQQVKLAWARLGHMLRPAEMRRLRNTFWYLGAWFLLSDAFTTITSTAVLFAKTSLQLPPSSLVIVGLLTPTAGILGSLLWPKIQHALKLPNKSVVIILVMLASIVPLYGCLGFLPGLKGHVGGLVTAGEMYVLAVYFGSIFGAFQAFSRAVFSELIPHGEEARWYGLYSITDKSSSFLGPLIVGVISDATGNIRYAFFFLVGMVWLALLPLLVVDVQAGRRDAENYVSG